MDVIQLERVVLVGMGAVCEACNRRGVIVAARMRINSILTCGEILAEI